MSLISQLNDDCWLDVLTRVDHDDLDELETVCKRMRSLSNASRSKAVKVEAFELKVIGPSDIELTVDEYYTLFLNKVENDTELFSDFRMNDDEEREEHYYVLIDSALLNRASVLLRRFKFESCDFTKVMIDNVFLDFMEHLAFTTITFSSCLFEKMRDFNSELHRFLCIILAGKPTNIHLSIDVSSRYVDESICENICEYAKTVDHPSLTLHLLGNHSIRASEDFTLLLPKFPSFVVRFIVFKTTYLMDALIKRLNAGLHGEWQFEITDDITQVDIERCLDPTMQYSRKDRNLYEISGANCFVRFSTMQLTIRPQLSFSARFIRHSL